MYSGYGDIIYPVRNVQVSKSVSMSNFYLFRNSPVMEAKPHWMQ